jgi:hypothetical protein
MWFVDWCRKLEGCHVVVITDENLESIAVFGIFVIHTIPKVDIIK